MISWLKKNWALALLIVFGLNWLFTNFFGYSLSPKRYSSTTLPVSGGAPKGFGSEIGGVFPQTTDMVAEYYPTNVAPSDSANRLVIKDTNLSLQVKDVETSLKQIEETTVSLGGYLVNSFLSKPDSIVSGNITIRLPEVKRTEALTAFKKLSVKVVSESISGTDVTDQYEDIDSRLAILNQTKLKYQEIMDRAITVSDLMNVQQHLTNLQTQIDSLKGRQKYLEQSAKLTKIDIYLSTDDLSLPYSPTNEWRPAVIFKQAVRSLIGTARSLGTLIIWLAVYSPILIIGYLIYRVIKNRRLQKA